MKYPSETIENSINEISKLPGIGKKTALRLSLHILKKEKEYSKSLADSIIDLKEKTMFCKQCHVISDKELCRNCDDENISIQKNNIDFETVIEREQEWIESSGFNKDPNIRLGVPLLRRVLSETLIERISKELPSIIRRLDVKIAKSKENEDFLTKLLPKKYF